MKGVVSALLNEMFLRCVPKGRARNSTGNLALHVGLGQVSNSRSFRLVREVPVPKGGVVGEVLPEPVEKDGKTVKLTLKPCPFCGSTALYHGGLGSLCQGIKCQECRGEIKRCPGVVDFPEDSETEYDRQIYLLVLAVRAWNRRAL